MRQNQNAKRSRGRGRRPNNSGQNSFNRNTTFESNGPEGRLRGNAQQLFEKYTSLANDAQSSGERVLFEANSQFADHYYRIQQSILANAEQRRQNDERSQAKKGPARSDDSDRADDKPQAQGDETAAEETVVEQPVAEETGVEQPVASASQDSDNADDDTSASDDSAAVA